VYVKTVLIVDDDFSTRRMYQRLLALEGYKTLTAQDGDEALECARRQKPDLVLLDYNLPGRNGLEVLADLKTLHHDLRFILVTASDDEGLETRTRRAGACFFGKPFAVQPLLDEIRSLLGVS
jgi:DNA-binding response OmpR family regulator